MKPDKLFTTAAIASQFGPSAALPTRFSNQHQSRTTSTDVARAPRAFCKPHEDHHRTGITLKRCSQESGTRVGNHLNPEKPVVGIYVANTVPDTKSRNDHKSAGSSVPSAAAAQEILHKLKGKAHEFEKGFPDAVHPIVEISKHALQRFMKTTEKLAHNQHEHQHHHSNQTDHPNHRVNKDIDYFHNVDRNQAKFRLTTELFREYFDPVLEEYLEKNNLNKSTELQESLNSFEALMQDIIKDVDFTTDPEELSKKLFKELEELGGLIEPQEGLMKRQSQEGNSYDRNRREEQNNKISSDEHLSLSARLWEVLFNVGTTAALYAIPIITVMLVLAYLADIWYDRRSRSPQVPGDSIELEEDTRLNGENATAPSEVSTPTVTGSGLHSHGGLHSSGLSVHRNS